jgi:hypothetical protein
MSERLVEIIGGPLSGQKVPLARSYLVFEITEKQAVYRHYYHNGWDYYIWVGWNNPTVQNCYLSEMP